MCHFLNAQDKLYPNDRAIGVRETSIAEIQTTRALITKLEDHMSRWKLPSALQTGNEEFVRRRPTQVPQPAKTTHHGLVIGLIV
jgi:hypothetical protein